jgi:RNA recognition motif-containing protein
MKKTKAIEREDQSGFVKNLSYFCTSADLELFFRQFLSPHNIFIEKATVWINYKNGKKTLYCGCVVVQVNNTDNINKVVSLMDGINFQGRKMR